HRLGEDMPATDRIPRQMYDLMDSVLDADYAACVLDGQAHVIDLDDDDDYHDVIAVAEPDPVDGPSRIHKFTYDPERKVILQRRLDAPLAEEEVHDAVRPRTYELLPIGPDSVRVTDSSSTGRWMIHRHDADPEHRHLHVRMAAAWFANSPAGTD